ncbi:MAG: hypothetical protein ABR530_08380, partial [Pyrinomonadaceae bacterium]
MDICKSVVSAGIRSKQGAAALALGEFSQARTDWFLNLGKPKNPVANAAGSDKRWTTGSKQKTFSLRLWSSRRNLAPSFYDKAAAG